MVRISNSNYRSVSSQLSTGEHRATKHDVVGSYKDSLKNVKLFVNGGVYPDEANKLLSGTSDLGLVHMHR